MAHILVILIVLTLTGEPVANALCFGWCDRPSERQHCGDAIAQPLASGITPTTSSCPALLDTGPFLREDGASIKSSPESRPLRGVAAVLPVADLFTMPRGAASMSNRGEATAGRPIPAPVLRV